MALSRWPLMAFLFRMVLAVPFCVTAVPSLAATEASHHSACWLRPYVVRIEATTEDNRTDKSVQNRKEGGKTNSPGPLEKEFGTAFFAKLGDDYFLVTAYHVLHKTVSFEVNYGDGDFDRIEGTDIVEISGGLVVDPITDVAVFKCKTDVAKKLKEKGLVPVPLKVIEERDYRGKKVYTGGFSVGALNPKAPPRQPFFHSLDLHFSYSSEAGKELGPLVHRDATETPVGVFYGVGVERGFSGAPIVYYEEGYASPALVAVLMGGKPLEEREKAQGAFGISVNQLIERIERGQASKLSYPLKHWWEPKYDIKASFRGSGPRNLKLPDYTRAWEDQFEGGKHWVRSTARLDRDGRLEGETTMATVPGGKWRGDVQIIVADATNSVLWQSVPGKHQFEVPVGKGTLEQTFKWSDRVPLDKVASADRVLVYHKPVGPVSGAAGERLGPVVVVTIGGREYLILRDPADAYRFPFLARNKPKRSTTRRPRSPYDLEWASALSCGGAIPTWTDSRPKATERATTRTDPLSSSGNRAPVREHRQIPELNRNRGLSAEYRSASGDRSNRNYGGPSNGLSRTPLDRIRNRERPISGWIGNETVPQDPLAAPQNR